jgi:uncharacterized protein YbjT (DUF2867 family)
MSKLITVFGATGNQGSSVISHILGDAQLSKEYKIRGITRDTSKASAVALSKKGVDVVSADLNSVDSLVQALSGTDVVFVVTNYWESMDGDVERQQGKNVTDAAKKAGVSHVIFSTLYNVTEETNGRLTHVPHFDSKADIAKYIRSSGLKYTFFLPGYYMSNYTQMLAKNDDGSYTLYYPVSDKAKFPLFDAAADTGLFVKAILKNLDSQNGKEVLAASGYYTPSEIVESFTKATGKKANYVQVSNDQYKQPLPEKLADEMLDNHLFVEEPGYYLGQSLDASLELLDSKPVSWEEFAKKNAAAWA